MPDQTDRHGDGEVSVRAEGARVHGVLARVVSGRFFAALGISGRHRKGNADYRGRGKGVQYVRYVGFCL